MLAPTWELALQIAAELEKLKNKTDEFRVVSVYGGQSIQNQLYEIKDGADFIIGTTGRVLDFVQKGQLNL